MTDDEIRAGFGDLKRTVGDLNGRFTAEIGDLKRTVGDLDARFTAAMADLDARFNAAFVSLSRTVGNLEGRFTVMTEVFARDMAEMKGTLGQLIPLLARIDQKLADVPSGAEFGELKGRVEEISRRLPTTLAYTPPDEKRRA